MFSHNDWVINPHTLKQFLAMERFGKAVIARDPSNFDAYRDAMVDQFYPQGYKLHLKWLAEWALKPFEKDIGLTALRIMVIRSYKVNFRLEREHLDQSMIDQRVLSKQREEAICKFATKWFVGGFSPDSIDNHFESWDEVYYSDVASYKSVHWDRLKTFTNTIVEIWNGVQCKLNAIEKNPTMYDYGALKNAKKALHAEFNCVSKLMKLKQ
jgi:hypothetical protein